MNSQRTQGSKMCSLSWAPARKIQARASSPCGCAGSFVTLRAAATPKLGLWKCQILFLFSFLFLYFLSSSSPFFPLLFIAFLVYPFWGIVRIMLFFGGSNGPRASGAWEWISVLKNKKKNNPEDWLFWDNPEKPAESQFKFQQMRIEAKESSEFIQIPRTTQRLEVVYFHLGFVVVFLQRECFMGWWIKI